MGSQGCSVQPERSRRGERRLVSSTPAHRLAAAPIFDQHHNAPISRTIDPPAWPGSGASSMGAADDEIRRSGNGLFGLRTPSSVNPPLPTERKVGHVSNGGYRAILRTYLAPSITVPTRYSVANVQPRLILRGGLRDAVNPSFDCANRCRRPSLAGGYLHSYASGDQVDSERRSGDCRGAMAVERLWSTRDVNQSSRGALRAPRRYRVHPQALRSTLMDVFLGRVRGTTY